MPSIYCISKMRINDSPYWREHVDTSHVIDGRPLLSLLRTILKTQGRRTLFVHAPRPRSVFLFLLLYRFLRPNRVKVVLQELNYDFRRYQQPKNALRWHPGRAWLSILVASCDHIICHSTQQVQDLQRLFPTRAQSIHFVKLPRGHNAPEAIETPVDQEAPYILVPGELRDFGIIFRMGDRLANASIPVKIVGRKQYLHQEGLDRITRDYGDMGIDVQYDLPPEQYLDLMAKARIVVIPTFNSGSANGQLTLLDAYALGKATICLDGANIWDYYDETSVVTYHESDETDLFNKIATLWEDPTARSRLKANASAYLNSFPTKNDFVRTIFAKCGIAPLPQTRDPNPSYASVHEKA